MSSSRKERAAASASSSNRLDPSTPRSSPPSKNPSGGSPNWVYASANAGMDTMLAEQMRASENHTMSSSSFNSNEESSASMLTPYRPISESRPITSSASGTEERKVPEA